MAIILIVAMGPVMLILALNTKIQWGRRIIFRQKRLGKLGKPFIIYKFRTLSLEHNKMGVQQEDLTKASRLIRRYALDELPQLFNILKGEMSFVGPRPLPLEYCDKITNFETRLSVRPGLTGLAQVRGRTQLSWSARFRLDKKYVENVNFILDLKILLKTPFALISSYETDPVLQ